MAARSRNSLWCSPSGLHVQAWKPAPQHRGFTLIELVAAMGVTAILLAAIGSTVVIATRALPKDNDAFSSPMVAARVVDQMAGELESALLVVQQTPTSITFTVPPRNGDAAPEKISYSWAGPSGAPLLRQYNSGPAVAILDAVDQFSLTPIAATSTESYPGVATEDASDSLLIDYSNTSSTGSLNVNSSTWVGQLFASSAWPAGVVGWRPTRVQYMGKQSGLIATTNILMALPLGNLAPGPFYAEQYTTTGTGLLASYGWQPYSFSTIDRLAPAAGICFVLQWAAGTPNSVIAENNNLAGLVQTTNGGSTWNYISNKALVCQLYGKLTRSSTTQYATSKYLTALSITLRAGPSTNPAVTTTAQLLNSPPMLSAYWVWDCTSNPTSLDSNGDGLPDWTSPSNTPFNASSVSGGTWQANGATLYSNPGDNFARLTLVDLRFAATSPGSWAGFSMNAARNGNICAPVLARITQQSDGSQTLQIWRKLNDSTPDTLLLIPGLPPGSTDLHLIIDPAYGSVGIRVNGVECGSFAYNAYASGDTSTSVQLSSSGTAQFNYVRIREAQP
ncbi:MAG TPA: prepilin-type N-terminal cleavage/methylation domain-containing protein [Tepidisphaeraceae bacterium]|jgi:prepilin-type N-terminal cleavage/methylation domain-containing protein